MSRPLLMIRELTVEFHTRGVVTTAVDQVTLSLDAGTMLALVGESGSGKTMTALAIGRLLPPAARWRAAEITVNGRPLHRASSVEVRRRLGREIAYVFQDPATSLNPVMTIEQQLCESGQARARALELLAAVQLADPAALLRCYPHQLSGGMQQRVMLALAIANRPALLIADEPTTALDATVQAQILSLLLTLRQEFGIAILLITHDLLQVARIADHLAVMHHGRLVETGPAAQLTRAPQHPYTQALLAAAQRLTL